MHEFIEKNSALYRLFMTIEIIFYSTVVFIWFLDEKNTTTEKPGTIYSNFNTLYLPNANVFDFFFQTYSQWLMKYVFIQFIWELNSCKYN